jgi:hypothetical protein
MVTLTIAIEMLAQNIKGRGRSPHLAPAGTKREQTMPRLLTCVLLNKYKVLAEPGRRPILSMITMTYG